MGFLHDIRHMTFREWIGLDTYEPDRTPRYMNTTDYDSLVGAGGRRNERAVAHSQKAVRDDFMVRLRAFHPVRMDRLNRDLRWLRRKARKHGIGDDELRMILW